MVAHGGHRGRLGKRSQLVSAGPHSGLCPLATGLGLGKIAGMSSLIESVAVASPTNRTAAVHVYVLSGALAVVGAVTTSLTFLVPDLLVGPPVTNGNARGTALVMLVLAIPTLLGSMWLTARGSWRAIMFWLGSLIYLAYNTFLLLFLTPFNSLFLLNTTTQSLAIFSIFALMCAVDRRWLVDQIGDLPARGLAVFVWTIVTLNALAWLQVVVPAMFAADPTSFLDGLGVATNAIYIQDFVVWLPLMATAAWWMWRHRPAGVLLTGSWLLFGVIESIGIAVDQWFGHRADPSSPHASETVIPFMILLAVINAIGAYFYLRARQPRKLPPSRSMWRSHGT